MSPYTTVREAAENVAGKFLAFFVAKHFDNHEEMKGMKCPVLIIHGKADPLIPYQHSVRLFEVLKKHGDKQGNLKYSKLYCQDNMTHNDFRLKHDIIKPVTDFINRIKNNIPYEDSPTGAQPDSPNLFSSIKKSKKRAGNPTNESTDQANEEVMTIK